MPLIGSDGNNIFPVDGSVADLGAVGTTPTYEIGSRVEANYGCKFEYVRAGAAVDKSNFVSIDANGTADSLTAANGLAGKKIGLAVVTMAAADYGWVAIEGNNIAGKCGAACGDAVALYTSATAGVLDDDATTTQAVVIGITAVVSVGAASAAVEVIMQNPSVGKFKAPAYT